MRFFIFFIAIFFSCQYPNKKIFIKSVRIDTSVRVDWYFYSHLNNFSRSYLQIHRDEGENEGVVFLESFFISDINFNADTLKIQLYKNDYKANLGLFLDKGLNISFDTLGGIWNQASSRLGRLQKRKVDYFKPHSADSYCLHRECY
jgi:hypothetical protein